ncbi:PIG-L deacetylase family protein [Lewinella sp. IMCC34183]|uniref:PIG-L deacetylase family protein n=1 Tax=Lewinella sp. IMCC34183 TaxID=2248762 RepID=UPI000E25EA4B|nr:PIG-L family deacetylase [Lewinella sp. IMCC34183]
MILALSPHLDDVVFSCGGYLYDKVQAGTRVQCVTIFTATVPVLSEFALACRLDKELDGTVDYMALRRAEDRNASALLGIDPLHWEFAEAPHRGYVSAPDLFAGVHDDDPLERARLDQKIREHLADAPYTEVLYPYGAGNHADHLQLIAAVERVRPAFPAVRFRRYYDMPYAARFRDRYPELGETVPAYPLGDATLRQKLAACAAYASQLGFQFGDRAGMEATLGLVEYLIYVR